MAQTIKTIPRDIVFGRSDMPLGIERYLDHADLEIHRHEFSELVVVVGGQGLHLTDQEDYVIRTGDVFVINGAQIHGYKNTQGLSIFNVYFDLNRLRLLLHDIGELPGFHALFTLEPQYRTRPRFRSRLTLSPEAMMPLQVSLERLEDEFKHCRLGFRAAATSIFTEIVVYLSRMYSESPPMASRALFRLSKTISYIENHYAEPITMDQLTSLSHLSPSALDRNFRRAKGYAPIDYLIRFRIMKAAELLVREDALSITEIAYRVGFTDSNYFTRQFKKLTGHTPRQYRRQSVHTILPPFSIPHG